MTRYALIDKMLANRHRAFSIQDITEMLREKLPEYDQSPVSKRCVEKDINYLQYESPFLVDIEEYRVEAADRNGRPYRKRCVRYSDPTFSIFKTKLTSDEKAVLTTALDTLGCFDGLENFEWLNDLRNRLELEKQEPIISISKNILANSTLIARLYTSIRHKCVIKLNYHTFKDAKLHEVDVTPHLIKEYNNRWFLIATACDTQRILTFALDRIDNFTDIYTAPYIEAPDDIEERYEDIIGITYIEENPLQEIVFWVSDTSKDYISTKPIHGSQTILKNDTENGLRERYHNLKGGAFFKIECKENYELIRELTSFGPELMVLSPPQIVNRIREWLDDMQYLYR